MSLRQPIPEGKHKINSLVDADIWLEAKVAATCMEMKTQDFINAGLHYIVDRYNSQSPEDFLEEFRLRLCLRGAI